MAVYARGYRRYEGPRRGAPPAWTIFREARRTATKSVAMRRLWILFLILFAAFAMGLYAAIGARDMAGIGDPATFSWDFLRATVRTFYGLITFLTALVAVLVASGLVSDDLKARALPLYLVRPLRPRDYVLGKALVLPAVLFNVAFLPGLAFLVLVSLWQPPGGAWTFFVDHLSLVRACAGHYLIASALYTGLALLLSSMTDRRGATAGMASAVIFGGTMFQGIGSRVKGTAGEVLRVLGFPLDTLVPVLEVTSESERWYRRAERGLPEIEHVAALAVVVLVAGLWAAWRRARTVEVVG